MLIVNSLIRGEQCLLPMSKKTVVLVLVATFSICSLIINGWFEKGDKEKSTDSHLVQQKKADNTAKDSGDDFYSRLVAGKIDELRGRYGLTIERIAVQVKLKTLRDDLLYRYPEMGLPLFMDVILGAFPEFVDRILNAISTMDAYEEWLVDNRLTLESMDFLQRKGAIWKKREELFGESAHEIWSDEIVSEAARDIAMAEAVEQLDTAYQTTMDERVYQFKAAYEENYGGTLQELIFRSKNALAGVFFSLDSVQKSLGSMQAEQRQSEINRICRDLGFDESQIAKYAARDQAKEKRWENGYAYMNERKQIEKKFSGDELQRRLDQLREQYFKEESGTIKREEEGLGFFRYQRPRVFGRN